MEPLVTLYEREPISADTLPSQLATLYGGGFSLPQQAQQEHP